MQIDRHRQHRQAIRDDRVFAGTDRIDHILKGRIRRHQPAPAPTPQFAQHQQPRPTTQQGAPVPNPPYMRPSGAPRPGAQAPTTTRKLTELEKRLAREAGMSEADYLNCLETPANKVIDSDIGKAGAK